jgi:hypothetical protein
MGNPQQSPGLLGIDERREGRGSLVDAAGAVPGQ